MDALAFGLGQLSFRQVRQFEIVEEQIDEFVPAQHKAERILAVAFARIGGLAAAFAGEWLFAESLYGPRPQSDHDYVKLVLRDTWQLDRSFTPAEDRTAADAAHARWTDAVERSKGWADA